MSDSGAPQTPTIALIAAMDRARAIGKNGALPWHLPPDLKRFKALTLGHTVLMGRKTFESIGKPLPGRRNVVLSRDPSFQRDGVEACRSLSAALRLCTSDTLWVIGGGEIYTLALPIAQRLEITHVDTEVTGADAWFPELPPEFNATTEFSGDLNGLGYQFCRWQRG
jgi:dihydrofolate reductase